MNLSKKAILIATSTALIASAAYAATPGAYVGVQLGQSNVRYTTQNTQGFHIGQTSKNKGFGYGINGGYNFSQYFGVEGSVNKFANVRISDTGIGNVGKARYYDVNVLAVGYLPIHNVFNLFAKGGAAFVKGKGYINQTTTSGSKTFVRPELALGASYDFTKNMSANISYSRVFGESSFTKTNYLPNLDMAAVGVAYNF